MEKEKIISSIAKRGNGEIYLGVVGAVRTGKSTFIKRFIENLVVPNITDEYVAEFAKKYGLTVEEAEKGMSYFRFQKPPTIKAKIQTNLEKLQHDSFFKMLHGGT